MGGTKLCLLLMLGTYALAQQEVGNADGQSPTCLLGKRFKNFRRYVYQYEAETLSGVTGATHVKNGPKVSCKVEIDVPQTCSFIVQTTECSLSKVVNMEAGAPVFGSMDAGAFEAAMAKNSLKVTVEGQTDVKLFPEADEPVNILNIKRGIISALVVPVLEEERNKQMATVHGVCDTVYTVNAAEDIATDVTITRDLSGCDSFIAQRDHTSPLALISGMHYPLSKMISSTQTCNYNFDNQKKHMTAGTCTEKHIFLPFSHQNEHGVSTEVKQTLTLQETNKINDRVFDHNEDNLKFLPMEAAEDKAPVQSTEAVMGAMRELNTLSEHSMGHQRAAIFQRLVSELRGLESETIRPHANEMMEMSIPLTFQALAQCGTPGCNSALLYILSTLDSSAPEVAAAVYALGFLPNPSRLMAKDMLEMARERTSKPSMYALSNVVRRLYKAEGITPEITAVSEFMASILGADCAGEKELTFLALRVVGNMGDAMEAADPSVKTTLLKCMRQPATTLSVQLAAIQAFRRMSVTEEVRSNIQRVSQYAKGAVQKRIAAYLILMRNPEASDLELVRKVLTQEQNAQVKAFVTSHIYNIINSEDPETQKLGSKILEVLQGNDVDIPSHTDYTTMSRNYKMGTEKASIYGNVIFDPSSQLPREALLETTLKAFGYNMDIWEIGMEGKGFETTIELLFGKNGFFPDTVSKAMYWAGDKMPGKINAVLEKLSPREGAEGQRKVPDNIVREIVRNFNKLAKDLQTQDSPEAMAYLKIMGAELGYIKGTDFKFIAQTAAMYAEILLYSMPTQAMKKLMSSTENEIFAHYIFMDNKFSLSTASGFPLKFALSGTFAPGAKGGIRISPDVKEVSFVPSVGVEFVTQMGVHIPEFYSSAIEMHTNLYHESALNAKITMVEENQVKLTLPAPQGKTQLFRISNRMLTVTSDGVTLIPPMDEGRTNVVNCNPLFTGVKYCTTVRYSVAGVNAAAPYFPLNGETKFAVDIEPTAEVAEYTATIAYKLLSESDEKVDSLTMILKAEPLEADQPTIEATATMKYNRNRNVITTDVQIPDYDVEVGIRVGITESSATGKSITLEISNKNIPQLSLIGRAKLQAMTDGMLQVQLLVPSLLTDAAITATMSNADQLTMEVKSDIKFLQTSSVQAVTFKYDEEQAEIQLMSNVNSDMKALVPYNEGLQAWLTQLAEDIMDQQLVISDMKPRHVFDKALEVGNIWMDKITTDVPYVETLKNSMAELAMPTMPEELFMAFESTLKYQFNKEHMTITIPLPLGGKSSMDLNIPSMFHTPRMTVPVMGLDLDSTEIQVPTFHIPSDYDLTLPLMGMVEVSAKVNSNYYNWQGLISAGNNTEDSPSYTAKFKVMADSPIELLSFTSEGTAEISDTPEDTLKVGINGNLKHKLMDTSFGLKETIAILDKVVLTGSCNFQATCPLGVQTSMDISSQCSLDSDMLTGDTEMEGSVTIGHATVSTSFSHTFAVEPVKKEARTESTLRLNSPTLEFLNKIKAGYADEQLLIESNTNMNNDPIKHTTKFSIGYKDAQLTIQSDSVTKAEERMVRSQVDFTASRAETSIRIENQADDTENRAYCLLSGSMNPSGVEINADASLNIFESRASHKATLTLNENGLSTSCTTTAQRSPMTFENVFHGGFDASGSTMAITTKGAIGENTAEVNAEGKLGTSEAYLNSVFEGNLLGGNTRNRVSLRLNEYGLDFSNNLVGSFDDDFKTESTHSLTLTLRSLALRSTTDNVLYDNYYKHDITADLGHFTAAVVMASDLKIMDVNFVNEAQYNAEPYKMELTGTSVGIFSGEEFKHSFEIIFTDMTFLAAKCNTNGKLLGTQMAHTTDMEIAGLNMKFNSVANFNSPSLRLDSTVKMVAEPFTLNIDALFNSNGEVHLYGEQSGELYSKFLLKAEPLAFTQSFECRASTTHELENGVVKINIDNKFNSLLTPQEQSVTLKMTSKLNEHTFDQEMNAYNNAEKMGLEVIGAASTNMLNSVGENQDYSISGSVKYDKNSDFFQIPFVEHLPALIEEMKDVIMRLMEDSIQTLRDINSKYDIRGLVKISEIQQVIDSFDLDLFVQDLKLFLNSMESYITTMLSKLPTKEIVNMLRSVVDSIMGWMKSFNFTDKFNVIYSKIEELLSNYEIEMIVETIMNGAVEIMRHYQVREKIQAAIAALKSIDIPDLLNQLIAPVKDLVNELYTFDFPQMVDDIRVYFEGLFQKIRSFDYETFTLELKEKLSEISQISCFGKLYGEFRIVSPDYTLRTTAELQNTTTTPLTPEFTVNLNSHATSTVDLLAYTLDASAHIAVPKMNRVSVSENVKAVHTAFSIDHQGTVTLYGLTVQASGKTTAKATSDPYQAELVSDAFFAMASGISATIDTAYNHEINMPLINIFSEASHNQKTALQVEAGTIRLTINNDGKAKYAIQGYSDEGTHKSDIEVAMDIHTIKVTFTGATNCKHLSMSQNVVADICIFSHVIIDAKAETETPFMTSSIAELKAQAKVEELKIDVTASHKAELVGRIEGTLSNSVIALVTPSELTFDTKNKWNIKPEVVDLQNDFIITLNSEIQQASWTGLAKFNQYKYSHYFTMDNGEREIEIFAQMNGEANLDVLKQPITIRAMRVPFLGVRTPSVDGYSLWEDTFLSTLLTTTEQTFEIDAKLTYTKNPDIVIDVEQIFDAINTNTNTLRKTLLIGKDTVVDVLTNSYEKGKEEYEKYSIEMPKTLTVPAYTVPVINVEVSSFTIPLPDLSLITMPTLHVPSAVSKLTLPKINFPEMQKIMIPAMGDLTYDFSMKTAVIKLKADASIINQGDVVVKIDASSSSEFDILIGNIEGTATLNRDNGMKVASILSVKHMWVDGNHDSTISITGEAVDASITNSAKVNLPILTMEVNQEMFVNPQEGLIVSVSSPSTGLLGFQVQTKHPVQVKGRLYGRYPSEPTNDVDILAVRMSLMNPEKLTIHATWNTELPYEMMLGLKERVPNVVSAESFQMIVSDPIVKTYAAIIRLVGILASSFEQAKEQANVVVRTLADNFDYFNISDVTTKVSESTMLILREYQKHVQKVLDAAIRFLRETKFQFPGFEEKLSGLEVYQKFSALVADVSEEAIIKVPEFFASKFETILDYIRSITFTLPGSSYSVSGGEILDNLLVALEKVQTQIIVIVQKLGDIQLDDTIERLSAFMHVTVEKTEELFTSLASNDLEQLFTWLSDVYTDAMKSKVLADITEQVHEARRIIKEYITVISEKLQDMFADMSIEQLNADIQSWIDSMVKRMNVFHNKVIEFLKEVTKDAESFVRVSDRQMDINIPFPFIANSN